MHADDRVSAGVRPVEKLFAIYAFLSGLALLFPHRPRVWPLIAALHILVIVTGSGLVVGRIRLPVWLRDLYPVLVVPLLYAELPLLNRAVWDGHYFDDLIIDIEGALFGGQPSLEWAAALPSLPISEVLHACYLSYYLLIFGPPLYLWLKGRRQAVRGAVFALMLTFFVHYLFFVYFPVQGPRYLFPPPGGVLADGFVYRLAHAALEAGSSQGAAFPSSHVAVGVAQSLIAWRWMPRAAPLITVVTIGLAIGAIYGGFHYAFDALVGAGLGIATVLVGFRIEPASD
jgi:membrane-associated phospholipid phosphatase